MEFHNEFDVKAPLDEVWDTMLDVERVAPCVPGAQVLERTGEDAYNVGIKVKVGPVSMQYRGQLEIVEKDPSAHRAVMSAKAKEARGQGTANAQVEMRLAENGGSTHGTIATDVQLSGKAAAMGQGVIQDVSARIVDQFAENLAAMLSGEEAAAAPEPAAATAEAAPAAAAPPPRVEPPPPAADEGLDVLPLVSAMVADRMRDPRVLLGTLGFSLLLGYLLGRARR
jgi:carbon monoxide dehydrogenase subunit G